MNLTVPLSKQYPINGEVAYAKNGNVLNNWKQIGNVLDCDIAQNSDIQNLFTNVIALQIIVQSILDIDLILVSGATINISVNQVNAGNIVIGSTDSSGTTVVNLPDATQTTDGSIIRFSMVGNNILELKTISSGQTIDGDDASGGLKVRRPSSSAVSGWLVPKQATGVYSYSGVWKTITND